MKAQRGPRHSSVLSLTSALDGGGWSTSRLGHFTPGKDPVPIVLEAGVSAFLSLDPDWANSFVSRPQG